MSAKRKRRPSEWLKVSDANRLAKHCLTDELTELSIEFAARPDRCWTAMDDPPENRFPSKGLKTWVTA